MKLCLALALFCVAAVNGLSAPLHTKAHPKDVKPSNNVNGRIILGETAEHGQFPWHASLFITVESGDVFICGASLIDESWAMTAAHCVGDGISWELRLGSVSWYDPLHRVWATYGLKHPGYDPASLEHDIGLIRFDEPVAFEEAIQPIALPHRGLDYQFVDAIATVQGHGALYEGGLSEALQFVNLLVISNPDCLNYYSFIPDSTLCAVGHIDSRHGTCSGDSGGSLIYEFDGAWRQIGVISFVSTAGCDSEGPSGYARVSYYLDWIAETTGIDIP